MNVAQRCEFTQVYFLIYHLYWLYLCTYHCSEFYKCTSFTIHNNIRKTFVFYPTYTLLYFRSMEAFFNINLPTSWQSLSDRQLLHFFTLLSKDHSFEEILTLCLLHWGNLRVLRRLPSNDYLVKQRAKPKTEAVLSLRQIQNATNTLAFLKSFPPFPTRITLIGKAKAITADFQGVPFSTFISVDNYYQGFL